MRAWKLATIAVLLLGLLGVSCAPAPTHEPARPKRLRINHEIEELVITRGRDLSLTDTTAIARAWSILSGFYEHRRYRPIWSHALHPSHEAHRLLDAIRRTEESGLDPADYDLERLTRWMVEAERPAAAADSLEPRTLARFDVLATYAYLLAADHQREGRVPRATLDPDWTRDSLPGGGTDALRQTLGKDPSRLFGDLEPRHEGYVRLRAALARYRAIAARGGWPEIPPGPPLSLGARDPRVALLVRRLAASGDFTTPIADTVFDRVLEQAVGDFQTRQGIPRSGVLGEATRVVLNVPVEKRIRQMELNLERWRWLPDTLGRRHIEVNIPAYRLELVRDGLVTRAMRVVVGRRASPTPIFSDRVTYIEINPTWTLPPSVVAKEIAPKLKRKKDYLQANHMHVISIADAKRDTIEPKKVPWQNAASDSFPFLVIQEAGPENPLGQIKLMCPNEYDVYLHDTPLRGRFSVAVRDYSHGCVRLEHATELADSLLRTAQGDSVPVDSLVATGKWKRVILEESVPVHFLYWTAWADSAGRMQFRDDIYGLDRRLDEVLRGRATSGFVLNPDVGISAYWLAAEAKARELAAERAARTQIKRP